MAEWRSNLIWAPIMIATIAGVVALATMELLTTPVGLGLAAGAGVLLARW